MLKSILLFSFTLIIFGQTHAETVIQCNASGKTDNILSLTVSNSDIYGNVIVQTIYRVGAKDITAKLHESQGSYLDSRVLVSSEDKSWQGTDLVYLEKSASGYNLVKYNKCNSYYQEETCSAMEPESELSRELVSCVKTESPY